MNQILQLITIASLLNTGITSAQNKALTNTSKSSFATLSSVNMGDVKWTNGFWADKFDVCRDSMVPNLWQIYNDASLSHAFKNFEIAAGLDTGTHKGPSFHDGDFYKTLEAVASLYASTKDPKLDEQMDKAIAVIAKAQRADGYIYTKAAIEQQHTSEKKQFEDRLSFEAYNIGHLMTAACVHYRATGKTNFLDIAKKATDYLYTFYQKASPEIARNAICPSHYMGIVEMYRTVGDQKYLTLAKKLIDIRGEAPGTDDNSDRYRFRDMQEVVGHAVRANYLFAGVADLYLEQGDSTLLSTLGTMWNDVVQHKMYITGGCGALHDGVSNDGTSFNPNDVEKLHQAYGRDYQLPNLTAHNETCANIGNLLWNWRMLQISGDAKYADVMELALYNSVLSGVSLSGKKFFYTNPLAYKDDMPYKQRWTKESYNTLNAADNKKFGYVGDKLTWSRDRVDYISLSNCCPPNVVRTVAEVSNYAYSISDKGVWFNLYGSNNLNTKLSNGASIQITQQTDYPWDGNINVTVDKPVTTSFFFRVPEWANDASIKINGTMYKTNLTTGKYFEVARKWLKGDMVQIILPMKAKLIEANPLVEETRNQVAVKRGPIVYCLESIDFPSNENISDVALSSTINLSPKMISIKNNKLIALQGDALLLKNNFQSQLYKEVSSKKPQSIHIQLIPYYAWANRGKTDMTVWMPLRN